MPLFRLLVILLLLVACGSTQRERTIKATLTAVNETRDAFVTFDQVTQSAIVDMAPTFERGSAMLAIYRKKREPVVEAFAVVYRAIAIAATANSDASVIGMLTAAKQIAAAWKQLKEGEYAP
jgi:hypothetical protein